MLQAEYDYDTDIAVQQKEAFNDGFSAGEERGISLGTYQKAVETAKNALSMKLTLEQIASLTGLSVEVIQDLADK